MIDTGLTGQVVLVTGGAAVSRAFAAEGARVVIHHLGKRATAPEGVTWEHTMPDGAEALAAELGGTAVSTDLAAPDAAARLFDATGQVDVLVNNAAHCESLDTIDTLTAASLERHYRVNAVAPPPHWAPATSVAARVPFARTRQTKLSTARADQGFRRPWPLEWPRGGPPGSGGGCLRNHLGWR